MSHFAVVVVTKEYPTDEVLSKALQPYHEYECTGIVDEYVKHIDETDDVLSSYESNTTRFLIDPEGNKHSPYTDAGEYDPRFLRPATQDEIANRYDLPAGVRLTSGPLGYDKHVFVLPSGWQDVYLPSKENGLTILDHAKDYYGAEHVIRIHSTDTFDLETHAHPQERFVVVDENDNLLKYYKFTNPNKKWDWWQIGGRYTGRFSDGYDPEKDPRNLEPNRFKKLPTDPDLVPKWPTDWVEFDGDIIQKSALNLDKIIQKRSIEIGLEFDRLIAKIRDFNFRLWSEITEGGDYSDRARKEYNSQQAVIALRGDWVEAPTMKYFRDKDRDGYVKNVASTWVAPYAFVHNGNWYEKGEMGWFGLSNDKIDQLSWHDHFLGMIDSLDETDWITVVDCHI